MLTTSYVRGTNHANRYSHIEQTEGGWMARQSDSGAPVWIIESVDRDYLQGLYDGGCKVRTIANVPRPSKIEMLRQHVAWLMRSA